MIKNTRVLAICVATLLNNFAYAEAPVVDESENFAILNQQFAANEQELTPDDNANSYQVADENNDSPLATEQELQPEDNQAPLVQDGDEITQSDLSLVNKIQQLQQELQELRGQLEIQAHDLKLLQKQQLAFYKDLDARLSQNTGKEVASSNTPKSVISSSRTNPLDEQVSYLAAYDLIKNKQFDEAISAMQNFVTNYPSGGYTANAQYWLGELYLQKKDYPQAIDHFKIVLSDFSHSSKSAPSLLKLGFALDATGDKEQAIQKLEQVISQYPDTNSSKLARERLAKIKRS